jgi:hypothetical protein
MFNNSTEEFSMSRKKLLLSLAFLPFMACNEDSPVSQSRPGAGSDSIPHLTASQIRENRAMMMTASDSVATPTDSSRLDDGVGFPLNLGGRKSLGKVAGETDPYIIIYAAINYGGKAYVIDGSSGGGGRDYNHLGYADRANGGWNDQISSIKFYNNAQAYFCNESNWGGTCKLLNSNIADLRTVAFNDVISSIRWPDTNPNTTSGVRIFAAKDYGGGGMLLQYPFDYNILPNGFNDVVSSYQVSAPMNPTFWTAAEWWVESGGSSFSSYESNVPFVGYAWNDVFSSMSW